MFFPRLRNTGLIAFLIICLSSILLQSKSNEIQSNNTNPPLNPVRLVFIHHSTGGNWLADSWGGLGKALKQNNYYVSDVCYGWGKNSIGDRTDIGNWWEWFRDPDNSSDYLSELYQIDQMDGQYGEYERLSQNPDPNGENVIVMFKSCFPNSNLYGNINDPPPQIKDNHIKGESAGSESYTVANAKGIYIDLLEYFKTRLDKLFIVITAPPLIESEYSGNARAFNLWLVNDWLKNYPNKNVFVFDFYNCLTTNGGSPEVNDLGSQTGNHHRWYNNAIQHTFDGTSNTLKYPSDDDHPNPTGNAKTTAEYLPLLNLAYNNWINSNPDDIKEAVNSTNEISFKISPNPMSDYSIINYILPDISELRMGLYNSIGLNIENFSIKPSYRIGSYKFNFSNINNGRYFLKINSEWGINVIPILIYN